MMKERSTGHCHGNVVLAIACRSSGRIKEPGGVHTKEGAQHGEGVELSVWFR